jgi:hypothetical protein
VNSKHRRPGVSNIKFAAKQQIEDRVEDIEVSHFLVLSMSYVISFLTCLKQSKSLIPGINSNRPFLYAICVLAVASLASGGFVHPGMLHTQADFTRMAQKVAAKQSPWIDSYNKLITNGHTGSDYPSHAQAYINRGSGCSPNNVANLCKDAAAVYDLSLLWKITGNASYATQAVGILNSWASTLTGIGCQNGNSHDFIWQPAFRDTSLLMQQKFCAVTRAGLRRNSQLFKR